MAASPGRKTAMTTKLNLKSVTVNEGQTVRAGAFIASHSLPFAKYAVYDDGANGGHFKVNGHAKADGKWITLTAAQFASLKYVAGSGAGSETLSIKAYDGQHWTSIHSLTVTTTAAPPSGVAAHIQDP